MKKHRLLLTLLLALILLAGCSSGGKEPIPTPPPATNTPSQEDNNKKEEEEKPNDTPEEDKPTPEINVSSELLEKGLEYKYEGGSQTIEFTTNVKWTLSQLEQSEWCKPSATSGEAGKATVTFTVSANEETQTRETTITIQAETAKKTFKITQEAKPEPTTNDLNGNVNNMPWGSL